MGNLKFNGVSTADLGLVIQTPPAYTFPAKDTETQHVPGRNGDVVIDNDCYENVERSYSLACVFRQGTDFVENSQKIIAWLNSLSGYARLEDSYDPLVYRIAAYKGSGSLPNLFDIATTLDVVFVCKPQRFLKSGEKDVEFDSNIAEIKNPSDEKSLPVITITGVAASSLDDVILLTDKDSDGNIVSSITISALPVNSVTLDSEAQSVYYDSSRYLTEYVGLNGKIFPTLGKGVSTISINAYTQKSNYFTKFNDIIDSKKETCKAKYEPYDTLVEGKQSKFYFKSYDRLKESKEESYEAESYLTLLSEKAESYTFASYNDLLTQYCERIGFTGTDSSYPDWLEVTQSEDGNSNISKAKIGGFFMAESEKSITYRSAGSQICEVSTSATTNIIYYPAVMVNGKPEMKINYSDFPSWLSVSIKYNNDNVEGRSPTSVNYIANADGYFWKDKDSMFGSSSWNKYSKSEQSIIGSVNWSTWKKAFLPFSGMSTSTSTTFTFKYTPSAIQYEPVLEGTVVKNKVHFRVEINSNDLKTIQFKVNDAGYYRCNDSASNSWTYLEKDGTISTAKSSTSASNTIYFLESVPDYSEEKDFPSKWLSPSPIISGTPINPTSINGYVVKETGYYRNSKKDSSGTLTYSSWAKLNAGDTFNFTSPYSSVDDYYLCYIENLPSKYEPHDMSFNDSNNPPSWLHVDYIMDTTDPTVVKYVKYTVNANASGYFKWDTNDKWVKLLAGAEIVTSAYKEDTTIYYMASIPNYDTYDNYTTTIESTSAGNPNVVIISPKADGYYRANNDTDWTFYKVGEEILESKVTDSNTIYRLEEKADAMTNVKIKIKPRWWML
jgi:phage-related protein